MTKQNVIRPRTRAGHVKKKAGAGKAKGSAFERDICKALSLWISKGARDDLYWRSAMSGGRATIAKKKGKDLAHVSGDICAIHPDGNVLTDHFFIECKNYSDLAWHKFILSNTGPLVDFWRKARAQAHQHGKQPLLILKQNQYPIMVMVKLCRLGQEDQTDIYPRGCTILPLKRMLELSPSIFMSARRVV